jgi:hypothetical protein
MKRLWISLSVLVLVAVAAFYTNPTTEQHKQAATAHFRSELEAEIQQNASKLPEGLRGVQSIVKTAFGESMINNLVQKGVSSKNYYLFSLTEFTFDNEVHTIGVGAFQRVFIFATAEDLKKKLEEKPKKR